MKKLLVGLVLLTSMNSFASEIIADLQYECSRVDLSQNTDVRTISVYYASTLFNKKRVFIGDYGSLIKTNLEKINKGVVIKFYAGYEKDNKLTISFSNDFSSSLEIGSRVVEMDCVSR